jgi:hypothetical protein
VTKESNGTNNEVFGIVKIRDAKSGETRDDHLMARKKKTTGTLVQ